MASEQQAKPPTWSRRSDAPPPAGFKPILSYDIANDYRDFLANQAQVAEPRKRFEGFSGPIRSLDVRPDTKGAPPSP